MKTIPLTKGLVAMVDDEDFDLINQSTWCATTGRYTNYAVRSQWMKQEKRYQSYSMHRVILGLTDSRVHVDHIDHNGLNNQRSNLRRADHKKNARNCLSTVGSTSRFVGVAWSSRERKWVAQIKNAGKTLRLGFFTCELEAAIRRDVEAKKLFGSFAHLNVLMP